MQQTWLNKLNLKYVLTAVFNQIKVIRAQCYFANANDFNYMDKKYFQWSAEESQLN